MGVMQGMKKLVGATAVCALAIGLVAAPAAGVKSPKLVSGSVEVGVEPSPLPDTSAGVNLLGNLATSSDCRKDRTVHFSWISNGVAGPQASSAVTRPNGDLAASLPRPTQTSTTTPSVTLHTTVDAVSRTVGSKKKGKKAKRGRRFECLGLTADVTVQLQGPSS
jgi:hypothetical protein